MDFKFNFSVGGVVATENNAESAGKQKTKNIQMDNAFGCKKFDVEGILNHWSLGNLSEISTMDIVTVDEGLSFTVVTPGQDTGNTDLIPCVYEGGFKVWECTLDLIRHLHDVSGDLLKDKVVLDLGCGVGLLGIYSLITGVQRVTFQDYNESVILQATGPSAIANFFKHWRRYPQDGAIEQKSPEQKANFVVSDLPDYDIISKNDDFVKSAMGKIDFWAGDWSHLSKNETFAVEKYDVILSSETIYNSSGYDKLHNFLQASLNPEGVIYMGAKSHYFGVGGGVSSWCDYVNNVGVFDVNIVGTIAAGLKRQILCLRFRK